MNYSKRQTDLASFFKKWEGGLSRDPKDTASVDPCPTPYKGKTGYHKQRNHISNLEIILWKKATISVFMICPMLIGFKFLKKVIGIQWQK